MRAASATPKPLLPLNGSPILEHQIEWLKNADFNEIFLCLGHQAEEIKAYFGDGSPWGVKLDYRVESSPRGTAGAVRDLDKAVREDLLLVYGDLHIEMDPRSFIDFHNSHCGIATLLVRHTDHPDDSDIVEVEEDGRIRAIGRLSSGKVSGDLGCAAIWIIKPGLLDYIPTDAPSDFARDIFPKALADGRALMAFSTEAVVADVGTPERYEAWQRRLG